MREILVIENDSTVARFLVEVFSQQGWFAYAPRDGPQVASALLGSVYYDIITISYRFPGTTGVKIIRLIRELEHRKQTPVLMITGSPVVTGEALAAGAAEVLYKPIEPHSLVSAVLRHAVLLIAS